VSTPRSQDPTAFDAGTGGPPSGSKYTVIGSGEEITRNGGNIPDEFTAEISNEPGTVSMANTGQPNSGGSQFFINVVHNDFLDFFNSRTPSKHPVFGKVVSDADLKLIQEIVSVPSKNDKPTTPVVMESITIED
jgi:cyclophilin family peptidyl-prolyl cis-trans isomerase